MNTAVSGATTPRRGATIIVDGDLACFHDAARTPDFAGQFTSARFSELALRQLPYTEPYRNLTLRVEYLSMVRQPKSDFVEAMFRVYAPVEGGYDYLGDYLARALTDLADGEADFKRLPGWPKPAERAVLVRYRDGHYASLLHVANRHGFVEHLEQCDDPFLRFVIAEVGRGEGTLPEGGAEQLMTRVTSLQTAYQHLTVGIA